MGQPNVVLFVVDGLRTDALGCHGSPLGATPRMDALAAQGIRFNRAFCPHSVCMPTRASLFTGCYPHVHGVWANGVALPPGEVTLPQVMAAAGYATAAVGKVHFEPQQPYPRQIAPVIPAGVPYYGFGEVHLSENCLGQEYLDHIAAVCPAWSERAARRERMPEELHDLQWITDQGIDFARRQVAQGRPFLLACSFHELIPPCTPPDTYAGRYHPADMTVPVLDEADLARRPAFYRQCHEGYQRCGRQPDEAQLRAYIASYYDQLAFIDQQLGRLLDALAAAGVADDTVVLLTADHGLSLNDHYQWRHGPFLFDQVVNVPMVWRGPGLGAAAAPVEELVESVDVMATVLDLCGLPVPPGVQGVSLAPLLRGDAGASGRDAVLLQERQAPDLLARGLDPSTVDLLAVRTAEWKLIHAVNGAPGELYDLVNDPGEFVNRWADPAYQTTRRGLEGLLLERLGASRDPLPQRTADW